MFYEILSVPQNNVMDLNNVICFRDRRIILGRLPKEVDYFR